MSFFDSGTLSLDWLQEKALRALQDAARFVDLANEPDTTSWYAKRLRALSSPAVGHLVPIVVHLYQVGDEAASGEHVEAILKGGTFALARWSKRWKIVDPTKAAFDAFAPERSDEELDEKAETPPEDVVSVEDARAMNLRLEVHGAMALAMLHEDLPDAGKRILCWLLWNLMRSPYADIVVVSRKFLPGDTNRTPDETAAAYRALYERGLVERVDHLPDLREDALALRLVASGLNASKHPAPYREEKFGYPGARIGGKPTLGNELWVYPSEALGKVAERWRGKDDDLAALGEAMQRALGEDRVYIETVRLGSTERGPVLRVRLRYPFEANDAEVTAELKVVADGWLREQVLLT
jgi:hypothetical protein